MTNPESGSQTGAPLIRAAFGLGLLFFDLYTLTTGSIRISKAGSGTFIHYIDHPVTFVVTCLLAGFGGILILSNARKRYLMHH